MPNKVLITCSFCLQKLCEVEKTSTLLEIEELQNLHRCQLKVGSATDLGFWVTLESETIAHKFWRERNNNA